MMKRKGLNRQVELNWTPLVGHIYSNFQFKIHFDSWKICKSRKHILIILLSKPISFNVFSLICGLISRWIKNKKCIGEFCFPLSAECSDKAVAHVYTCCAPVIQFGAHNEIRYRESGRVERLGWFYDELRCLSGGGDLIPWRTAER